MDAVMPNDYSLAWDPHFIASSPLLEEIPKPLFPPYDSPEDSPIHLEKLLVISPDWDPLSPLAQDLARAFNLSFFPCLDDALRNPQADTDCCILLKTNVNPRSAIVRLRSHQLTAPILILTDQATISLVLASFKAGASGFHYSPFSSSQIIADIRLIVRTESTLRQNRKAAISARSRLAYLTPRELQVTKLLVAGAGNKQAATELGISERTIEHHRARIISKLNLTGIVELVHLFMIADADNASFLHVRDSIAMPRHKH